MPGAWAIEPGCMPPPHHAPSRLLARVTTLQRMAVTLRTATLLPLNLGIETAACLARSGCAIAPIAALALHEVLVNAALHGNLEICNNDIATWHDLEQRERLIAAALADPVKSTRLVTLAVGWNASGALAAIIDEGAGYPHAARHSHLPDSARLATGRGLVIARAAGGVRVLRGGRCTRLTICRLPPSVTHA